MYNGWVSNICAAAGRVCQSVLDLLQMGREPPRRALHTRVLGPRCGRLVLPIGQSDAVGTAGQAGGVFGGGRCSARATHVLAASPVASAACRMRGLETHAPAA